MAVPEGFSLINEPQQAPPPGFAILPAQDAPQEEKLNFAQRMGENLLNRANMLQDINEAVASGEQSTVEGAFQVYGKIGAGLILDTLGEGLISGIRGLSAITPDIIENPAIDFVTSAAHEFLNTDIGKRGLEAAQEGLAAWEFFKNEHPRAARNIESVVNVVLILAPAKSKPKAAPRTNPIGWAAKNLDDLATRQDTASRVGFIDDLVRPKQTAAVRTEQVGRTAEVGLIRSKVVTPSAAEQRMALHVNNVPGVSSRSTLQGNYVAIQREVARETDDLIRVLDANGALIPRNQTRAAMTLSRQRIAQNPLLVGNAETTANRIITKADDLLKSNPGTSSGVLRTRKQLDAWIRSQKGDKIFDPTLENAQSIALRDVRQSLNAIVQQRSPQLGVSESLSRQSNLLSAMDNIAPKAADEAGNMILRAWQDTMRVLPIRGEFNQIMATGFGIGGLGYSAMFAPFLPKLLLGGLVTYAGGRAIMSATVKRGLSTLLTKMDDAIKVATNPEMIAQLRLDRAALVEILNTTLPEQQQPEQPMLGQGQESSQALPQ